MRAMPKAKLRKTEEYMKVSFHEKLAAWSQAVLALTTCILLIVGFTQLNIVAETNKETFSWNFNRALFTEKNTRLLLLIDNDCLKMEMLDADNPYFVVDMKKAEKYLRVFDADKQGTEAKKTYSGYEIEHLLDYFDELNKYEEKRLMDIRSIYVDNQYYIRTVWENKEIQKYINCTHGHKYCEGVNVGFEKLYKKIVKYGEMHSKTIQNSEGKG